MQLRATRAGAIGNRRQTALTLSQLLPAGAGRVAAIYTDPAKPGYDECIQKNMAAIAAGRPQDRVLFADAAGQTPVTYPIGAGQGKGLLLDRSAGLVRGVELANPDLQTWSIYNTPINITANSFEADAAGDGLISMTLVVGRTYELNVSGSAPGGVAFQTNAGTIYKVGFGRAIFLAAHSQLLIRASAAGVVTIDNISVREIPGHHQRQPTAAARGEFSRRYNQLLDTATLATQSITAIATNYRLYFTGAGTVTLSGAATGVYSAGSHTITCTAGSLTLTVAGSVLTADCRFEADATIGFPVYQRVTTASDYDETNFPTYWRAVTDDWAKSHMDPAGATKAYVFWAGQKMSDAANGVALETSTNAPATNGAILVFAPGAVDTGHYSFASRGTALAAAPTTGRNAPHRATLIGQGDITNDISSIIVNGTTTTNTADQGTGTYLEYDVFFASRAGTVYFANIREYAPPTILFLQPADSLSASHLAKLQKGYAKAVGVTL